MPVDWTQVLLAVITMLGSVASAWFSLRSGRHSRRAAVSAQRAIVSADRAEEASLRPPPGGAE